MQNNEDKLIPLLCKKCGGKLLPNLKCEYCGTLHYLFDKSKDVNQVPDEIINHVYDERSGSAYDWRYGSGVTGTSFNHGEWHTFSGSYQRGHRHNVTVEEPPVIAGSTSMFTGEMSKDVIHSMSIVDSAKEMIQRILGEK